MKLYYPITVDLYNTNPLPVMKAQQNNVGRGALITLTANGEVLAITEETVRIFTKRPDGFVSYLDCSILEDGKIQADFTDQMLASEGIVEVELELTTAETNITTPIFIVEVNKSNVKEGVESSNEYKALERFAEELTKITEEALEKMIPNEEKGQPNGVASLDETGKVPEEQLPYESKGDYSFKSGLNCSATKLCAQAFGRDALAAGSYAFSQGYNAKSTAFSTFSSGYDVEANGEFSSVLGRRLIANGHYQHIRGRYNILTTRNYIHIVGNGTNVEHRSNAHTLDGQGNAWYQGSIQSTGSDYAEYFEWLDGNPDNEDRVGLLVTLDGEKIRLANAGDEILGIISGTVAVLGDNYEWEWNGKYLTDDFGRVIYDMVEEFVEIPHTEVDDEGNMTESIEIKSLGFFEHPRINPNYDPEQEYVNRSDRPEWDAVGMLGKLFVRDDGTAQVNGYVTVGENGIATASSEKTNMRVLSRVNENVVRVLLK